jgi:hypothetical protein
MVQVSFLRPIDQFLGARRFLDSFKEYLQRADFDELLISVAFAKTGPLLRAQPFIREWRRRGKQVKAIFGVDMQGTSKQALEFALVNFDEVYITHSTSHSTFHPKFYLFVGEESAVCIHGSHNLTVGGTETNLEGGTIIQITRPEDEATFQEALSCWTSLLPADCEMTRRLDVELLDELVRGAYIFDERAKPPKHSASEASPDGASQEGITRPSPFPRSYPKPPSPVPNEVLPPRRSSSKSFKKATKKAAKQAAKRVVPIPAATSFRDLSTDALVIQIVPHPNGEVFLSKLAVDQQPAFFGFPFTGRTVPKQRNNPSYPQRIPDPVVNITIYDRQGNPSLTRLNFNLNTVFYERKSEIRITFSPDIIRAIVPFSIMVMRQTTEDRDYDIEVFNPGSPRYEDYLTSCNQTLPSGGAQRARRMGWL